VAEGDDLIDGLGVRFRDYRSLLPECAADFPRARIVRCPRTVESYRYNWLRCQVCGLSLPLTRDGEVHHIIGGAGRSDEEANLLRVGGAFECGCHDESWSVMLPAALWAKQRTDQENTDWVRLAVLLGHFLPEPKPPSWYNEKR